jgi:hypothetical protein
MLSEVVSHMILLLPKFDEGTQEKNFLGIFPINIQIAFATKPSHFLHEEG